MSPTSTGRAAGLAGLAWGALLLARGDGLWRTVAGRAPSEVEGGVVAVLGARHLGQGLLQVAAPTRLTGLWLLTDLAHAASMVALAVADPGRRRPALVSAAVSATTAVAALGAVRSGRRAPGPAAPLVTPRRARRPRR
ncbi:hypothetical protein ACFFOM_19915 [Microlunatus capsulatus]|uniref:DUF4267 domain-containing protein n=1 Tax=Microlunatus capsulatus TaxID=99117 RepID=A0ABS4Z6T1_9ACTN|nr:hypothetical protein [Microlunatus capsulatus]MBP2416752.1 hypothetical protein [Microlunatus capsulatus]